MQKREITVDKVRLTVRIIGSGPTLLLLHGYPQNHRCWLKVLPELQKHFTCVLPDLRGYGESEAPSDDSDHYTYSKRRMALDVIGILDALNLPSAHVLGHDRGARVAYRMALDHPLRVTKLGIIEIVPTGDFWRAWNAELAMKAYHWTFLAQPSPLPERLIDAHPREYIEATLKSWILHGGLDVFPPESLESYLSQAEDPKRIAAMCADYRAGATYDRNADEADRKARAQINCPTLFIWARNGFPAKSGNAAEVWRAWAPDLEDHAIESGHFAMEENPGAVLEAVLPFFKE